MSHTQNKTGIFRAGLRQKSWGWLLRQLILPLGDAAFGQGMMRRLITLEAAQWWPAGRIARERDAALQRLVRVIAAEVPFYRDYMEKAGVSPGDIRTPADLPESLPVATKALLRAHYPQGVTRPTGHKRSDGPGHRTYEARTSGSTGENFVVLEDAETAGWYRAAFMLSLEWAGWQIGEPHLQTGMTLQRSPDRKLKDFLLRCHYVSAYDLSDTHLDAALDLLEKHNIQHLWGYPGSLYLLARRARALGWNRPLRSAVTWGDNLYQHYRRTIEAAFHTPVTDTYGCAEGIQIAAQCEAGSYHIHELDTLVELLDEQGCPVAPGQPGAVVVTRLHPGPMPLVRYRVGDVALAAPAAAPCPCGRGFALLGSIQGREPDIIVTPSGNRLIVHFFSGLLEHFAEIDTFQVVQDRLEAISLRIVPTPQYSSSSTRSIVERLKSMGAGDMEIEVELVDAIPLPPSGKRRFIISNLPNGDQ